MHSRSTSLTQARSSLLNSRAAQMRAQPSPSELRLWLAIRKGQLGVQFRRQVVIENYIVDFLAPAQRLVLEVDGAYHRQRVVPDARRDRALGAAGFRVLRVQETLIMSDLPEALRTVRAALGV